MLRTFGCVVLLALAFSACDKKKTGEEFPVTFDTRTIEMTTITKVDSIAGKDSSFTKLNISNSKIASIVRENFNANNQAVGTENISFNYNSVKNLVNIAYQTNYEQNVEVSYENGEKKQIFNYENKAGFNWDDSTIAYVLPEPGSKRPSSATITYYWVHGGKKVAYRNQDIAYFYYSGNKVTRIETYYSGVIDSIYDANLSVTQTNYDTTQNLIYAEDTVAMIKNIHRYSSLNRQNPLQEYMPLYFNGFTSFTVSGTDYPSQVIIETFDSGVLETRKYITYEYINEPVTGNLIILNEYHSFVGAETNPSNLRRTYRFKGL